MNDNTLSTSGMPADLTEAIAKVVRDGRQYGVEVTIRSQVDQPDNTDLDVSLNSSFAPLGTWRWKCHRCGAVRAMKGWTREDAAEDGRQHQRTACPASTSWTVLR